jgi:hypothetical protein
MRRFLIALSVTMVLVFSAVAGTHVEISCLRSEGAFDFSEPIKLRIRLTSSSFGV